MSCQNESESREKEGVRNGETWTKRWADIGGDEGKRKPSGK